MSSASAGGGWSQGTWPQGAYTGTTAEAEEEGSDAGTDTDTASDSGGECEVPAGLPLNVTPTMLAAPLYWAYTRANVQWRRFMEKPVRGVRRFIRRHDQQGKGKGN